MERAYKSQAAHPAESLAVRRIVQERQELTAAKKRDEWLKTKEELQRKQADVI